MLLAGLKSNEPIPGFVSDKVVLRQLVVRGVGGHDARSIRAALAVIAGRRYPTERMHAPVQVGRRRESRAQRRPRGRR